ncbi:MULTISPECIES: ClpP-like prohead protease/major capsid protein fusion protein [Serratia]|uniref:ClpP-like prohead protease/major capsid protein fusion protein n=1 Tax=Serratia TaxID=613 RepID=UPI00217702B5|nr:MULTISPECIES: ClpP-like prohead protease/major capsid protein fusion protein [Serratia]CAI1776740.1 ATP-dependent Clp protease proteolytic subunit [Serratia liquefaciens]CAI1812664.1 ATP-dependent Clp protease proteolytic subunit [Serratia marcescens]
MKGWYSIQAKAGGTASISIYDEIGMWGITARQFSDDLTALGRVSHIELHIHSPGGDVFEGIAIYNLLKNHPARITVTIDGIAASMASVIAMVGDKVRMPENAMMMIHRPWGIQGGDSAEMRRYADLLDKIEETLIPAYAAKTGKTSEDLAAMLEAETWMNGKECVEQGFADELLEPVQAMARLESKRIEGMNMPETVKNMIVAPQASAPTNSMPEQERINGIKNLFAMFGGRHADLQASCVEDASCTVDQAKDKILTLMGQGATPSNKVQAGIHIHAGNGNITGDSIRQGLYSRLGHEKAERDNPYALMSLFDMAKASLVDRGVSVMGYGNRSQIVNLAFTHSTSDFSSILAGGAEKSVLAGWQDSGETFQQWTKTGSLSNFHEAKRVGLNGFSSLDKVPEGAEYKYVTTSDSGVPIALATYGNIFSITRQAIINDDLSQLTTIPQRMGRAAARTVGSLVYLTLIGNDKFTDGKALFHADHHNLIGKGMTTEGLSEARKAMRLQMDANGDPLNVTPAFIIVPAELEAAAMRAVQSSSSLFQIGEGAGGDAMLNQNAGIINVVKDMGQIVVEPRLDKANNKEWYVAAAKGTDTVEVAYLDGIDTPYLEQQEGFTVDGVAWKVRIDAGVAALDYRGLVKSNGE